MNRKLYPPDWDAIALSVKQSADWTCQECGKPCRKPGEDLVSLLARIKPTQWIADLVEGESLEEVVIRSGRFTLTVAHLNHIPSDCSADNLRAWCAPCHCRYDLRQMDVKQRLRLESQGQLNLLSALDQQATPRDSCQKP